MIVRRVRARRIAGRAAVIFVFGVFQAIQRSNNVSGINCADIAAYTKRTGLFRPEGVRLNRAASQTEITTTRFCYMFLYHQAWIGGKFVNAGTSHILVT